jgi:hypothetical protein
VPEKEVVQDPLKPLDQLYEPDERQNNFVFGLEDMHAELSAIILNDSVPIDVRQLFETAKNLSLYSWFVYRFHQASELIAFSALEMALRERYIFENSIEPNENKRPPTLYNLLQHANNKKWISNEKFPSLYARAKCLAEHKKTINLIQTHDFEKEPSVRREEPSEEDVQLALAELDMVEAITSSAHKVRNNLAHGSRTLHPNSISTLITTSEVINQIYP